MGDDLGCGQVEPEVPDPAFDLRVMLGEIWLYLHSPRDGVETGLAALVATAAP
ncbi:hypothetical protein AB0M34_30665 [Nocardia sp. NPDC050193]